MTIHLETLNSLLISALCLCCFIVFILLGILALFPTTTHPRHKMRATPKKVPYHRNTYPLDYIDFALPAGRLQIQPNLVTVFFGNTWGYTMPASRTEDIKIWVHEFVEGTIAWILHKMFGHHDFIISVVNQNIKYKHKVMHLITSLSHVSYMSNGYTRLSPDEYEDMFFGRNINDKEED